MPNWVKNVVKMEGIAKLPLFTEEENQYTHEMEKKFDFNKLIPMPESLNIESGSITDQAIIYFMTERCTIPLSVLPQEKKEIVEKLVTNSFSKEWAKEVFNRAMEAAYGKSKGEKNELYEKGKTYIENYQSYGCTTWYDWCCRHWGTKWNACDTEVVSDDEIQFSTAWSCPEPIMKKLLEVYPEAHIEHWWADEDMGNNSGYREAYEGVWYGDYNDFCSNEAYDTYVKCWGETNCLFKDEDGNWSRRTCEECKSCD